MYFSVASRVLMGIGIACFCLALAVEVKAQQNYYCWQTSYAHCGYHPCRCEDGTTTFGCTEGYSGGPTGWCYEGGTRFCVKNAVGCGDKVSFDAPNSCENCSGGTEQVGIECNKSHDCIMNAES